MHDRVSGIRRAGRLIALDLHGRHAHGRSRRKIDAVVLIDRAGGVGQMQELRRAGGGDVLDLRECAGVAHQAVDVQGHTL